MGSRTHPGASSWAELGGRAGLSLIELMVAMAVLTVAILGFLSAETYSMRAENSAGEHMVAETFAAKQVEGLRASYCAVATPPAPGDPAWSVLYADYVNLAKSSLWQVPVPGLVNGSARIFLVFDESDLSTVAMEAGVGRLRTATAAGTLVNGSISGDSDWTDGLCTTPDVTAANPYVLVPVLVRITWEGVDGPQTFRLQARLSKRG